jgi:hypothetical protein
VARENLNEMTLEWRSEGSEGTYPVEIQWKSLLDTR